MVSLFHPSQIENSKRESRHAPRRLGWTSRRCPARQPPHACIAPGSAIVSAGPDQVLAARPEGQRELNRRARPPWLAERLYLSVRTVERHLSNIYAKLRIGPRLPPRRHATRSPGSSHRHYVYAARRGRQFAWWRRWQAAGPPVPSGPCDATAPRPGSRVPLRRCSWRCSPPRQGSFRSPRILPDLARDLGVSMATAGGLRVLSGVAGGVTALALVRVWRRLGLRDLIRLGALLVCLGSLFGAAAPSFPLLAAAQVAVGAGVAATLSGAVAAAAEWSRPSDRSRVLSWALAGQPASWVVCMPVIGVLSELGWRAAMIPPAIAAVTALIAVCGRPAEGASPPSASPRAALRGRPVVAGWAIGELFAYAGWGGTLVFAGALMVESYGASVGLTGVILGAGALAYRNVIARRYVDSRSQQLLVALGIAMATGVALFGACRPALWLSGLLFAVLVLLAGGRIIAGSAFGLDAAPEHKVALMSVRAAATQFGYLVGAGLGGRPGRGWLLAPRCGAGHAVRPRRRAVSPRDAWFPGRGVRSPIIAPPTQDDDRPRGTLRRGPLWRLLCHESAEFPSPSPPSLAHRTTSGRTTGYADDARSPRRSRSLHAVRALGPRLWREPAAPSWTRSHLKRRRKRGLVTRDPRRGRKPAGEPAARVRLVDPPGAAPAASSDSGLRPRQRIRRGGGRARAARRSGGRAPR